MPPIRPSMPVASSVYAKAAAAKDTQPLHRNEHHEARHDTGHAHAHGHAQHGPAHPAPHGPTPRRRPSKSQKKSKPRSKRAGSASHSDDDELDIPDAQEHGAAAGVAQVAFDGQQRDGGDDDAEGGDERRRQNAIHRSRMPADGGADGIVGARRLPRLHGPTLERSLSRFVQAAREHVDAGLPGLAGKLRELKLRLLQDAEVTGVARRDRRGQATLYRLDSGGLARVKEHLTAVLPHSPAQRPKAPADERTARAHCMLVAALLELQVPMTPTMRQEQIARLKVLNKGR